MVAAASPDPGWRAQHDWALARRCGTDRAAREAVYRTHVQAVYGVVYRICGSAADAEDIVQDTFIEAFRCIGSYSGRGSLVGWLRRLAIRKAVTFKRQQRSRGPHLGLVGDAHDEGPHAAARLSARARLQRVYELLDEIPEERRVVFILHEVEGYRLPEVAALLGISVTAAKKRVWRARREVHAAARKDPLLAGVVPTSDEGGAL